jgi:ATP-dependent Clp protease ATP-binding subunit ClpC
MSKGLSPRVQRLLAVLAQDEGKKTGSEQLLPEHYLLALLKSGEGLGYLVLQQLRIKVLTFQLILEQSIPVRLAEPVFGELPPSRRLRAMLDTAAIEARAMRFDYIGTEHTILAAVKEEQSIAWQYFKKIGVSSEEVRAALLEISRAHVSSANDSLFAKSVFPFLGGAHGGGPSQRQKQAPSILQEFSRDITALARAGEVDPVVGRGREIRRVIQVLSRRTKNNPVLIGDPGVGKTAIAEGLALRIARGNVPRNLLEKRLLTLDVAQIIAGTKYRGEFEERIKRIIKEITEQRNVILFIDELHTIIGAGGAEGAMDASNMLKPALARGELQCIGATTLAEYRKYFERDAALERRFQIVHVDEPSEKETREILLGIKKKYEDYHGVEYSDEVIDTVVKFSRRYITGRFLPDKAIDILDEAGAMKKIEDEERPAELAELEESIERLTKEKQLLAQNQNYESAAEARDKVRILRQQLDMFKDRWEKNISSARRPVGVNDICRVVETMTGIPASELDTAESKRLLTMERELHKEVVGQDEAVSAISASIRRTRAGVSSDRRPSGSFIFLGPTGVGKTQLAKTLSRFLFGAEDSLVRIDMSDFMEKHNTRRLVGAPPGYIGYEDGGILTERVRRKPYSVILLDEIEKAHPDVFNLLLQILEEGELQDSLGHVVNFRNTVIIMTSNAGVRQISSENRLGFDTRKDNAMSYNEIKSNAMNELKKLMSPELLNRIDEVVVFHTLSRGEVAAIVDLRMAELFERVKEKHLSITVTKAARAYIAENGYNPPMGARPMRRIIQNEIEDPLANMILEGRAAAGSAVSVDYKKGAVKISVKKPAAIEGSGKEQPAGLATVQETASVFSVSP